jgi:multicomponent Na+:H+ antiporter subunit E
MSEESTPKSDLLVIVESDETASQTTRYALQEARDLRAESGGSVTVEILIIAARQSESDSSRTVAHVEETVSAFDPQRELETTVEILEWPGEGTERLSERLLRYVGERGTSHLVVDGNTAVSVERLRETLGTGRVELAPTGGAPRRRRLLHPGGLRRFGTIFCMTYLFYLAIGGFVGGLDLLTGALSAGVVGVSLSRIAFSEEPTVRRTGARVARMIVFLPVLFWEIAKANFVIAYIILHPRLPVDPSLDVVETEHHTHTRDTHSGRRGPGVYDSLADGRRSE